MDRRGVLQAGLGAAGLLTAGTLRAGTSAARVTIDASAPLSPIRPLLGVAGIPGPTPAYGRYMDMTPNWRRSRASMVRSYDWVARLDTIDNPESLFPRWAADPTDPASYNFAAADEWVRQVNAIGAEVLFTVASEIPRNKLPASDLPKYELVVEHIVRHFAQGWGGGPSNRVRFWEFSDQPDFGKLHFAGTAGDFYSMFEAFARAVRRVDPSLQVGGPGLAFPLNPDTGHRESFLDFLKSRSLPLDFLSFNWFSDGTGDPMDLRVVATKLRDMLDQRGFQQTKIFSDSWNYMGIPVNHAPPAETAAFIAAAGIYTVDSPLDRACYFRADSGWDPHYNFQDPAGFLGPDGKTDQRMLAVESLGQALSGQRLRLTGGDDDGFAALASWDKHADVVRVLIANHARPAKFAGPRASDILSFKIPIGEHRVQMDFQLTPHRPVTNVQRPEQVNLQLRNLPWKTRRLSVSRLLVDGTGSQTSPSVVATAHGRIDLAAPLAPPSFALFEIGPQTAAIRKGDK